MLIRGQSFSDHGHDESNHVNFNFDHQLTHSLCKLFLNGEGANFFLAVSLQWNGGGSKQPLIVALTIENWLDGD